MYKYDRTFWVTICNLTFRVSMFLMQNIAKKLEIQVSQELLNWFNAYGLFLYLQKTMLF